MSSDSLAILVGGGPAPGINGVIAAAAIEAINSGLKVYGIYDGYAQLAKGEIKNFIELSADDVALVHATGGSILRTSRTNPAKDDKTLQNCVNALTKLGVRYLVTIGGDDTTYGATRIAQMMQGRVSVAAVPKTIDNDLPLPDDVPTFGFETARTIGTGIIESLMVDARTTGRWYLAVSMGRKSGSLALSICKSAGATLAVIPEEFPGAELDLNAVVNTIVGAVVKRKAKGHNNGVAVIAEGIVESLSEKQLEAFENVPRDSFGHIRLADIPLGPLLRDAVRNRLSEIGIDATVVTKDIGYELRCAKPVPFDADYTRTLGHGAVRYLLGGGSGALMALKGGRVVPLQLAELQDPQTGRVRVRNVDTSTHYYQVARRYMTRLEAGDMQEPALKHVAAQTTLSPGDFRAQFEAVAQI